MEKWKKFERLVAAINATKIKEASVIWDDQISGRQFDVTVRFQAGDYDYLTVIECKDYTSKIPVEKIDAFVTKSTSVNANKAIVVSSSGFQSGCEEVAKSHGIELFTLTETYELPEEILHSLVTPAINYNEICLVRRGKKSKIIFDDGPKLLYLMLQTIITNPDTVNISLNTIFSLWGNNNFSNLSRESMMFKIYVPNNAIVDTPDFGKFNDIKYVEFKASIVDANIIDSPALDPHLVELSGRKIILEESLSGKKSEIKFTEIDHGFDTVLIEKMFYHSQNLGFDYYCETIKDGLINWILLESYQHGKRIDARFTQKIDNAKGYTKINNRVKLAKLKKYLRKFYKNEKDNKSFNV